MIIFEKNENLLNWLKLI